MTLYVNSSERYFFLNDFLRLGVIKKRLYCWLERKKSSLLNYNLSLINILKDHNFIKDILPK